MKKGITIISAIVLIVIIGYAYANKTATAPTNESSSIQNSTNADALPTEPTATTSTSDTSGTVIVSYDGTAFSPASITVKAGTAVTFMNQSSSPMHVASNPHPTHTDLPGFDELTEVGNAGSYTYTFTKVGTWGYHNHTNPSQKGTVVVQ